MKQNSKIISVLLLLCILCPAFTACDGGKVPVVTDTETVTAVETEALISNEAALTVDGQINFRIVRGEDASDEEVAAAVKLRTTLIGMYPGTTINIVSDLVAGEYDSEAVEILVGNTNYPETQTILDSLNYGDAAIRVCGHKIVIISGSTVIYNTLTDKFFQALAQAADKNNVTLKDGDNYSLTYNQSLNSIPVVKGQKVTMINSCGDSAYQLYFSHGTADMLDGFVKDCVGMGFQNVSDRTIANNRYVSLIDSKTSVTAYYTEYNKALRIITEPAENFYSAEKKDYAALTTPMMTMIGRHFSTNSTYLGYDANDGLMCFMFRLSDGRYIVIDGGTGDNSVASFSSALYAKMLEQAVDKNNIVIAAWFITHAHGDHYGGFRSFLANYSTKVKIESILFNFPSVADSKVANDETIKDYSSILGSISSYYPKTPVYKIHTGQQYNIADALVEVYYTHEDFVAKGRTIASVKNNWNNTSCIFSVDIAGQRFMFLGDCQETGNNLTAAIYGSYLKSDFVQIAHHGGVGGTRAIYTAVDADVAFFTTSDELVGVYINKWDYNYHLVSNLHLKEYFNSDKRITTFALPYTPKSSGFNKATAN